MRLQFKRERDYEQRRRVAISRPTDAAFDLINRAGGILRSYRQTTVYEPNMDAYNAACSPPFDDCMERQEERMRQVLRRRKLSLAQQQREWRQAYQDTVKEKPRPPGTVAMF